jgi:hypothetical protein
MLCSPLKVNDVYDEHTASIIRFFLPPTFTLVSFSAYSLTLKMKAICSSETSVNFQRTTLRYIPEDSAPRIFESKHANMATTRNFQYQCLAGDVESLVIIFPVNN